MLSLKGEQLSQFSGTVGFLRLPNFQAPNHKSSKQTRMSLSTFLAAEQLSQLLSACRKLEAQRSSYIFLQSYSLF